MTRDSCFKKINLTSAYLRHRCFAVLLLLVIIWIAFHGRGDTRKDLYQNRWKSRSVAHERLMNVSLSLGRAEKYIKHRLSIRKTLSDKDMCKRYDNEANARDLVFSYVWTEPNTPFEDVTLVTFMSVGKFKVLDMVLKQWSGPISISIYVDDTSSENLLPELKKRPHFLDRRRVELSIIPGGFEFMPKNVMRQVALDQARTSHVMLFDIDLIFSQSLYKNLLSVKKEFTNKRKVLVIPAFELSGHVEVFKFPQNKSEVVDYYKRNVLRLFHAESQPSYRQVDLEKWINIASTYKIEYALHFEPYVFAEKKILPKYPVKLRGSFFNKSEFICILNASLCEFHVSHRDFSIHHPHHRKTSNFLECALKYIPCLNQKPVERLTWSPYKPSEAQESMWIF